MDDLDALCSALETGGADGAANGTAVALPVGSIDRPELQQRQHAVLGPVCTNSPQKLRHAGTAQLAKSNPKSKASHKSNENGLGALVSKQQREAKAKAATASAAQRKEAPPPPPRRVFQDAGQATAVFRASGGLRVKNPVVSSSQLTTLMESMACIRIDQLRQRIIQDTIPKRWCTIGVVGELSTPRTTEGTGAQYGIWKLTDLNESMMYLYVFGSAYQDYKRSIAPGTLVCVVGGKTRRNGDSVNLSIDAYTQLVVLGESRDFGFCKGRTKSGDACRIPVNATRCEYCSYHVGKAYRELSSLRKELQGGSLKTAFGANKSKLKWNVGKFQSNTSGSNGNGEAQREAGLARLQSSAARVGGEHTMGTKYLVTCADPVKALNAVRDAESKKRQTSVAKGTGFLKQAPIPARHLASVVVGERIGRETGSKRGRKNASDDVKVKKKQKHGVVCGGGGGGVGGVSAPPSQAAMVNLDDDVGTSFAASLSSSLPARAQAAAIIQAKRASGEAIGQAPAAPAFLAKSLQAHKDKKQKTVSTKLTAKPAARPGKPATAVAKTHGKASLPPPDPGSFAALFGDVIREMEETHGSEGKVESRYKEAVEGEDHANLMSRLDVLEKKDAMAQKMEETTHLQVKAYRCEACSSLTERRHERCLKEHPHAISRIDTAKRWWTCSDCRKGFSTLGVSYPRGCCVKCGSTVATFDKRGMHKPGLDSAQRWAEAQGNAAIACREGMQPRGAEHGKFMSR